MSIHNLEASYGRREQSYIFLMPGLSSWSIDNSDLSSKKGVYEGHESWGSQSNQLLDSLTCRNSISLCHVRIAVCRSLKSWCPSGYTGAILEETSHCSPLLMASQQNVSLLPTILMLTYAPCSSQQPCWSRVYCHKCHGKRRLLWWTIPFQQALRLLGDRYICQDFLHAGISKGIDALGI